MSKTNSIIIENDFEEVNGDPLNAGEVADLAQKHSDLTSGEVGGKPVNSSEVPVLYLEKVQSGCDLTSDIQSLAKWQVDDEEDGEYITKRRTKIISDLIQADARQEYKKRRTWFRPKLVMECVPKENVPVADSDHYKRKSWFHKSTKNNDVPSFFAEQGVFDDGEAPGQYIVRQRKDGDQGPYLTIWRTLNRYSCDNPTGDILPYKTKKQKFIDLKISNMETGGVCFQKTSPLSRFGTLEDVVVFGRSKGFLNFHFMDIDLRRPKKYTLRPWRGDDFVNSCSCKINLGDMHRDLAEHILEDAATGVYILHREKIAAFEEGSDFEGLGVDHVILSVKAEGYVHHFELARSKALTIDAALYFRNVDELTGHYTQNQELPVRGLGRLGRRMIDILAEQVERAFRIETDGKSTRVTDLDGKQLSVKTISCKAASEHLKSGTGSGRFLLAYCPGCKLICFHLYTTFNVARIPIIIKQNKLFLAVANLKWYRKTFDSIKDIIDFHARNSVSCLADCNQFMSLEDGKEYNPGLEKFYRFFTPYQFPATQLDKIIKDFQAVPSGTFAIYKKIEGLTGSFTLRSSESGLLIKVERQLLCFVLNKKDGIFIVRNNGLNFIKGPIDSLVEQLRKFGIVKLALHDALNPELRKIYCKTHPNSGTEYEYIMKEKDRREKRRNILECISQREGAPEILHKYKIQSKDDSKLDKILRQAEEMASENEALPIQRDRPDDITQRDVRFSLPFSLRKQLITTGVRSERSNEQAVQAPSYVSDPNANILYKSNQTRSKSPKTDEANVVHPAPM